MEVGTSPLHNRDRCKDGRMDAADEGLVRLVDVETDKPRKDTIVDKISLEILATIIPCNISESFGSRKNHLHQHKSNKFLCIVATNFYEYSPSQMHILHMFYKYFNC